MDANPQNDLCLDYVNAFKDQDWQAELCGHVFERLINWVVESGAVDISEIEMLRLKVGQDPDAIDLILRRSRDLWEMLNRIFAAMVAQDQPPKRDLDALNRVLARTLGRLQIVALDTGFSWSWKNEANSPDRIFWPVIRSAADLLISKDCSRIRRCDSETCSWLFIDTSRNGRRRWCDMATCGNRAKARRFYERHREGR